MTARFTASALIRQIATDELYGLAANPLPEVAVRGCSGLG